MSNTHTHTDCRCSDKSICVHKVKAHRVKADTAVIEDLYVEKLHTVEDAQINNLKTMNLDVDCLMINQACGINADTSINGNSSVSGNSTIGGSLTIGTPREVQLGSRATVATVTINGNTALNGPVAVAASLKVETDHDVGGNSRTTGSHDVGADCNVTGNSHVYGSCQTDGDHTVNGCSKPNCLVVRSGPSTFNGTSTFNGPVVVTAPNTLTASVTGNVTGNVSGSASSFTGSLSGDVTGTQNATAVQKVGGVSAANVASGANAANAATSAAVANTIVKRDANGDFSAHSASMSGDMNVNGNINCNSNIYIQGKQVLVQNNEAWDYVIIGAGTAGCLMAKYLSDNHANSVLCLEEGDNRDTDPFILNIDYPTPGGTVANFTNAQAAMSGTLQHTYYHQWFAYPMGGFPSGVTTWSPYNDNAPGVSGSDTTFNFAPANTYAGGTAVLGVSNRNILYGGARVAGGTSSTNTQFWIRPSAPALNEWVKATGDSYYALGTDTSTPNSMLSRYGILESYVPSTVQLPGVTDQPGVPAIQSSVTNALYHGFNGPLGSRQQAPTTGGIKFAMAHVNRLNDPVYGFGPNTMSFVDDWSNATTPYNACAKIAVQQFADTTRASSSIAFFIPSGPNQTVTRDAANGVDMGVNGRRLKVVYNSTVVNVNWDQFTYSEPRATSISYIRNGLSYEVNINKKLILSAGISSAAILLKNGVGPQEDLEAAGIPLVINSPQVGRNIQNHPILSVALARVPAVVTGTIGNGSGAAGNQLNVTAVTSGTITLGMNVTGTACSFAGSITGSTLNVASVTGTGAIQVGQPILGTAAAFKAAISGTTLTVKSVQSGILGVGQYLVAFGIAKNSTIMSQLTGTPGGVGTYQLNMSQMMTSRFMTTTVFPGTTVTSFMTGSGGVGTYSVSVSQNIPSASMTSIIQPATYITAFGTGAGGIGTYTINKSLYVSNPIAITGQDSFRPGNGQLGDFSCTADTGLNTTNALFAIVPYGADGLGSYLCGGTALPGQIDTTIQRKFVYVTGATGANVTAVPYNPFARGFLKILKADKLAPVFVDLQYLSDPRDIVDGIAMCRYIVSYMKYLNTNSNNFNGQADASYTIPAAGAFGLTALNGLGIQVTGYQRIGGIVTVTTAAAHGLFPLSFISLVGIGAAMTPVDLTVDMVAAQVLTAPTTTTITYADPRADVAAQTFAAVGGVGTANAPLAVAPTSPAWSIGLVTGLRNMGGAGADLVSGIRNTYSQNHHFNGSCRMSKTPSVTTSDSGGVCDAYGNVWGARNVMVCDASIFPAQCDSNTATGTWVTALKIYQDLNTGRNPKTLMY